MANNDKEMKQMCYDPKCKGCPECQKNGVKRDSFKDSHSPAVRQVSLDELLEGHLSPQERAATAAYNQAMFEKNFEEKYKLEDWTLSEDKQSMYKTVK